MAVISSAPVAARLAQGDRESLEPASPLRFPDWPDDLARIIHIDSYGNLVTGCRASMANPATAISIGEHRPSWSRTFTDNAEGALFAYENSAGLLEIAANRASAAKLTGASIGDPVSVELQVQTRGSI